MILQNLRRNLDASTLILISHCQSTLSAFGRVLVLSGGRIVNGSGKDSFLISPGIRSEAKISMD
jgi:ABC-type bacteriocin/lantibiotic exporter with double-glycine peptidase domain